MNDPVLVRNPAIEEAPLQNELMLFDPVSAQFYVLNATMAFLWKNCDGTAPLPAIVDRAIEQFENSEPARVREEFEAAAAQLREMSLLVDTAQPAAL